MKERTDFILKPYTDPVTKIKLYEYEIVDGEFLVDFSELQESALIIESNKGDFRQFPTLGYGLQKNINGIFDSLIYRNDILDELSKDDLYPEDMILKDDGNGNITIELTY